MGSLWQLAGGRPGPKVGVKLLQPAPLGIFPACRGDQRGGRGPLGGQEEEEQGQLKEGGEGWRPTGGSTTSSTPAACFTLCSVEETPEETLSERLDDEV